MSKPFVTQEPTLTYDAELNALIARNGGWHSYSGTPDRYRFEFWVPDIPGPAPLGNTNYPYTPPNREYPSNPDANIVHSPAAGTWVCYVAAGVHSRHVRGDGTVAYDVIEWSDWAKTNAVTVAAQDPSPTPTPTPSPTVGVTLDSAQAKASAALYELVEERRRLGDSDEKIFPTLYYQVIRALAVPVGDGTRRRIADAIQEVLS